MINKRPSAKPILLLLLAVALLGLPPAANYAFTQVSDPESKSVECSQLVFATREDMVPPYVAIIIFSTDNFAVAVARPAGGPVAADVRKVASSESEQLLEEIASAMNGRNLRIFIYANANSRIHSFVTVLAALDELGLCDWSIVVNQDND